MSQFQKGIVVPIAIICLVIGLFISLVGWITNNTLSSINASIKDMGSKIDKLDNGKNDHEIRLTRIEEQILWMN